MPQPSLPLSEIIPYGDVSAMFARFQQEPWAQLFESGLHHADYGRYSYIAIDPYQIIWLKNQDFEINGEPGPLDQTPFQYLKTLLRESTQSHCPDLPPFQGGLAGVFAYDLYHHIEHITTTQRDEMQFPDLALGVYDVIISFDHLQKQAWVVSTGWPKTDPHERTAHAKARLAQWLKRINEPPPKRIPPSGVIRPEDISSSFDENTYLSAVQRVIDYILAGDVFEANISQCFKAPMPPGLSPFELFLRWRRHNPAPFSAFLNLGPFNVVSMSPERFLKLTESHVETRPIKGTRPRSANPIEDEQLAQALLSSEKDRAENVMIVDLLRNDLSNVCQDHSIHIRQLCGLERYATVHHLVSVVTGRLKKGHDALDLLLAAFPGGSITGAPKIRAIEIIDEIEPTQRGLYCGSIGFIGFNGAMDTSIAIRTCTIKNECITYQAGGAIVSDSNPIEEYQETLTKTMSLLRTLTTVD